MSHLAQPSLIPLKLEASWLRTLWDGLVLLNLVTFLSSLRLWGCIFSRLDWPYETHFSDLGSETVYYLSWNSFLSLSLAEFEALGHVTSGFELAKIGPERPQTIINNHTKLHPNLAFLSSQFMRRIPQSSPIMNYLEDRVPFPNMISKA